MAQRAPVLRRTGQGKKRYKWRSCPYSSCDNSERVPSGERTVHTVTSGWMELDIVDGHEGLAFRCTDPGCSYYLGTATTAITQSLRSTSIDPDTGAYTIQEVLVEVPMCSGTFFWEKA